MAITNAQQYKQLLAKGGRIGLKGGVDAATASFAKSYDKAMGNPEGTTTTSQKGNPNIGAGGASFNNNDNLNVPDKDTRDEQKERYEKQFFDKGEVPPLGSRPVCFKTKLDQRNKQKRLNYINYLQKQINAKLQKGLMDPSIPGVDVMTEEELLNLAPSVKDLVKKGEGSLKSIPDVSKYFREETKILSDPLNKGIKGLDDNIQKLKDLRAQIVAIYEFFIGSLIIPQLNDEDNNNETLGNENLSDYIKDEDNLSTLVSDAFGAGSGNNLNDD